MKRIAVLLLAVLGIFALCSCGDKEEITTEKFQSYFEEKGFEFVPMLEVDGEPYGFKQAIEWVGGQ